jgi:CHAT domain-containing protein
VAALRGALRDPKRVDVQQRARELDRKVMQPIRVMVGDATQLLISPDGELNLIPFEALVDEEGRYLVERFAISYLTTGRDLLRLQVPRASQSEPLIVADPFFGEPPTW